jgi:uncharacterized damage-inducible protein DinB
MKRVRALCMAALVLPATVGAQHHAAAPSQQPSANPITTAFKSFGYYGSWLIAAFDSIPASQYAFKPTPPQQSVGYVAQHLEDANYALCSRFGNVTRPMTAKDSLPDTVKATWPKDTLVARLRASLIFCRDAVENVNDANLAEEQTVGPPGAQRTVVRARSLMLFLTDLAEHYAQIASYMRILGLIPPSALPRPTP